MSNPFDRLRDALGDVPVPDQWPAIEARAAAGDLPGASAGARPRRPIAWWAAAAAAAALVVTGVVVLATRETADAPAGPPPGETVAPPDPSLPCRSEADLAALSSVLEAGQPEIDAEPPADFPELMGRSPHVVLVGSVVGISRRPDGYVSLQLDSPKYLHGEGPVDAISFRSQWTDATNPDPLAEPIEVRGAMIVAFARSLSSSPVWVADPDALYVGCAGTTVPAIGVRGGVPPFLGGSIDDIATQVATSLSIATPPPTSPAPASTVPSDAMPCTADADLEAVLDVLPGQRDVISDYDPATTLAQLLERTDTVFRATLASADRGTDESVILHVTNVRHLEGELADVTTIALGSAWPDVESPVRFDGAELIVFAREADGLPAEWKWVPDVQGLFAGCAGGLSYARPVHQPAPFLDHASLDAMAEQIVAATPGDPGPWGRPCTDQRGASEPPVADPFTDRPFGPLAAEPGLTVLYPLASSQPLYSDPVSSITRVPGGLLIRLQAAGPDGSDRLIAVVNDDGSVRWRRCLPDMYGWSAVVDDGVVHLEMSPDDGSGTTEWWSFDLATGESTVDAAASAEIPDLSEGWPPEVYFHFDGSSSVFHPLRRLAEDGTEIWRRDDLIDPGGEGFRTSEPQDTPGGEIVVVRACVGERNESTTEPNELPCPYALLGIDPDDGSTVWQLDGFFSVVLVADGYAIVTPTGGGEGWTTASFLIDVATGETVTHGVSDVPGAFYEECCGGYDYNRVESAGALAWTVALDRLNVWFPAGARGPGVTVDLLGPTAVPTVTSRLGMPVYGAAAGDCDSNCWYVLASGSGFSPGATVRVQCLTGRDGAWEPFGEPADLVVSPDGSVGVANLCVHGRDNGQVKVVIDGVESNVLVGG